MNLFRFFFFNCELIRHVYVRSNALNQWIGNSNWENKGEIFFLKFKSLNMKFSERKVDQRDKAVDMITIEVEIKTRWTPKWIKLEERNCSQSACACVVFISLWTLWLNEKFSRLINLTTWASNKQLLCVYSEGSKIIGFIAGFASLALLLRFGKTKTFSI